MRSTPLAVLVLLLLHLVAAPAAATTVDDLLFDFQLAPLDGKSPEPFTLAALDGRRVSLADLKGRVVFLYFWASW
jgi:cytochrome oxidase Cu insertion factor (SCO1/SenC/PrrC family)